MASTEVMKFIVSGGVTLFGNNGTHKDLRKKNEK
jgi:hypothetical protein